MTQFHEGQEVEVEPLSEMFGAWRKARIVRTYLSNDEFGPRKYEVEFDDGTRGVFDTNRIRELLEEVIEDIAKLLPEGVSAEGPSMTPKSLKAWRARLSWTKSKAASELGLSPNGYADYESGRWPIPRYIALACAAIAHGVPPIE